MAKATRGKVKPSKAPIILELTPHEAAVLFGVLGPIASPGEAIFQIYNALSKVAGGLEETPYPAYRAVMASFSTYNPELTQEYFEFSNKEAHTYDDAV